MISARRRILKRIPEVLAITSNVFALQPKEKPLRVKRARKDAQDTPSRPHSHSPSREVYPMASYQTTFTSVNPAIEAASHPTMTVTSSTNKKGLLRGVRAPKKPPNAYMMYDTISPGSRYLGQEY